MDKITGLFYLFLFISGNCCYGEIDLDVGSLEDLGDFVKNILGDKGIEKPEDVPALKSWLDQCNKTAGENQMRRIMEIPTRSYNCIRKYIKFSKLKEEIKEKMDRGELDLVFTDYCGRRGKIEKCLNKALKYIEPCMDKKQMKSLNITKKAADASFNFICSDNGDKIALFIAEEGIHCVKNRTNELETCIRETIPKTESVEADPKSLTIDDLLIHEENCKRFFSAHDCIVNITSKCDDPTPSNIINSIFTQALNVTPCARSDAPTLYRSYSSPVFIVPYFLTLLIAASTAAHILL